MSPLLFHCFLMIHEIEQTNNPSGRPVFLDQGPGPQPRRNLKVLQGLLAQRFGQVLGVLLFEWDLSARHGPVPAGRAPVADHGLYQFPRATPVAVCAHGQVQIVLVHAHADDPLGALQPQ